MPYARSKIAAAIAGAALVSVITPSHAQMLEEVIVTAQKRLEGLGDVPLSIQAVSGDALEQQDIFDFKGLVQQLPNVTIDSTPGSTSIRMRGVGTGAGNPAAEQAVAMFNDGVYISRGFQFNAPFTDIQSVEILKGPQGVLQGKNAVAGAVVITSRRPTAEFETILRTSYEFENEGYNLEGVVSGPLTDNLSGRLVAQKNLVGGWLDTNGRIAADGVTELKGHDDQNEDEFYLLRGSMVWDPTDTLSLFAKIETGERKRSGVHFGGLAIQPDAIVGGPNNDQTLITDDFYARDPNYGFITDGVVSNGFGNEYNAQLNLFEATNRDLGDKVENSSFTFQFDWETELGTVTGISGFSEYERDVKLANTMAPYDWLTDVGDMGDGGEQFDAFTQEIRLVSPGGETIDYIVGAFYMDRTIKENGSQSFINLTNGGLVAPPGFDFGTLLNYKEATEAWSVFGQVTWNILDTLRLNAGVRYTSETKKNDPHDVSVNFLVVSPIFNPIALDTFGIVPFTTQDMPTDKLKDKSTDPSVSLQWDATDEMMLYASYTQATKAGGFNSTAVNPDNTSYEPETANGYEIGMKGTFLDGRLFTAAALFYTEYDDLQVSTLDAATNSFFFENAASATTEGGEVEFRFAATQELELGGALGYTDATYDDFPGASCSVGSSQESNCDPATLTRNAKGDKLQGAPEWTGQLYADYRYPLSNGMELGFRGTMVYSDDFYINGQNDPYLQQDSFTKFDLVASLTSANGDWTVSVVGKNVTDKTTVSFGGATPLFTGAYWSNVDAPRQIFLTAEYRWH